MIPETVSEALNLWDAEDSVFSVDMGGLGPGYEMAIQGLAFELMRAIRDAAFTEWDNEEAMKHFEETVIEPVCLECDRKPWGGFSGAQVGAAKNLAACVCRKGYRVALEDEAVKDRLIQVCKKDLRGYTPAAG